MVSDVVIAEREALGKSRRLWRGSKTCQGRVLVAGLARAHWAPRL